MGRSKILRSPAMLGAGERHMTWNFDFMGKSKYFFAMSGMHPARSARSRWPPRSSNFGIDFESGTRVTASLEQDASVEEVRDAIAPAGPRRRQDPEVENPEFGQNVIQIKTSELGPGGVQRLERLLDREFDVTREGFSSESVGPTFGETVARSAAIAIIASLLLIMAYIAFRFEPKFAIPVMIALFHDLLITAGVYSLTGREVTTSTVAAILTILGYSLYDVVIVFDRIRENAPRMPRAAFSQIVNRSMSDVLTRSLATSMCTLMGVAALLLFGGETLKDFAFALLVGIASGTYSSIFIAAPGADRMEGTRADLPPATAAHRSTSTGSCPPYPVTTTAGEHEVDARRPAIVRRSASRAAGARPRPTPGPVATGGGRTGRTRSRRSSGWSTPRTATSWIWSRRRRRWGPRPSADRSAQLRAERAERKKQRAARQARKRKHGRAR